jgi:hypothetical protein
LGKASGAEEGQRLRGGKGRAFGREEGIRRDAQSAVMMEAAPASPFEVIQAEFILELLIVPLDPPAELGEAERARRSGSARGVGVPDDHAGLGVG